MGESRQRTWIAVVDDDPTWLATLGRALSREGYHTLLVGDGDRAATRIPHEEPAAVILDHRMPRTTGVELARGLRAAMGERCPPLILVTGDLRELAPGDRELFVAAYEKPVRLRRLMQELRRVIRGRKSSGTLRRADDDAAPGDDEESAAG
ncbi:MAG TPA: response regulator [Sandaracinaceae bacterium LLY-WYZ-13_1]|nr:response regulator [Sandaracinaceae bacterium LLY-WYZ-13_1]